MSAVYLVLLLLSAVCFALDAFTDVRSTRVNLTAAGLFFFVLVPLLEALQNL